MMMHHCRLSLLLVMALAALPADAFGHGTPIRVNVQGNQLVVSNGLAETVGYAEWIFADPDPELWLFPVTATEQFTDAPGFEINDLPVGQSVSLEIISRPDLTAADQPQRWLWHWNEATQQVDEAPDDPTLEILAQRTPNPNAFLRQWTPPTATTLKLADLLAGDLGAHRHLLAYFLDDSPPATAGVYGFFARLVAPGYESSNPFLVALNMNVFDEQQYFDGARQINVAAGLAADFDVDGDVDGDDFLTWQRDLGATGAYPPSDGSLNGLVDAADLAIWKEHFGRIVALPDDPPTVAIPEPTGVALAAAAALTLALRTGSRE
jgi:hypothetical protein